MNRSFILKGQYTKCTPYQFFDHHPESASIVFLRLRFHGILNDQDTPRLFDIRPFALDLVLKIVSELVSLH